MDEAKRQLATMDQAVLHDVKLFRFKRRGDHTNARCGVFPPVEADVQLRESFNVGLLEAGQTIGLAHETEGINLQVERHTVGWGAAKQNRFVPQEIPCKSAHEQKPDD